MSEALLALFGDLAHVVEDHDRLLGRVDLRRVQLELVVPTKALLEEHGKELVLEVLVVSVRWLAAKLDRAGELVLLVTLLVARLDEGEHRLVVLVRLLRCR